MMTLIGYNQHLRFYHLAGWLGALVLALFLGSSSANATPLLALKEAENCGGCHKPGRSQRPVLERRCTLDCQGCHVDPAGGGARNQWGYYYTHDQLNAWHFFKPQDPLEETSRFDLHYDGRLIQRRLAGENRSFPMSSEFTVRLRPFVEYLHLTYTGIWFGRIGDDVLRNDSYDDRRFREKYSVMVDALPLNTYIRAYRGQPMYGLRRPNHSLWIRERLGLDQYAMTEAIELGTTPNVPFFRVSQLRGDPYAEPEDQQKGISTHGGLRGVTMGWHVNGSTWDTESDKAEISMRALGAGASPWYFVVYGERNWRDVTLKESFNSGSESLRLHPSSMIDEYTVAFTGIPGVMFGGVLEELRDPDRDSLRRSVFVDFHPIPYVQMEFWRRFETGTNTLADTLAVFHLYADF